MYDFTLSNCKFDFASDNINIIVLLYDESGSMDCNKNAMREANKAFYNDFSKFEDKGSIAISKAVFSDYFYMSSFESIDSFNTAYSIDGGTELYYAITQAVENTVLYYNEIIKRLNVRPKITFLVFTDGGDTSDSYVRKNEAIEAIKEINTLDATTVFVAFGAAIPNKDGERLGFTCTREISTVSDLIQCLGKQLSRSCKEQSKSVYSLKSEFWSQVGQDSTEDDVDENPIDDDDFFNI